jgi:23S rRNA pseudouridine955/2504/2580 synthase
VHLAAQGHPIAGDEKYDSDEVRASLFAQGFRRMFLHAGSLEIPHPVTGEPLRLEAPLPPDCVALLQRLERDS